MVSPTLHVICALSHRYVPLQLHLNTNFSLQAGIPVVWSNFLQTYSTHILFEPNYAEQYLENVRNNLALKNFTLLVRQASRLWPINNLIQYYQQENYCFDLLFIMGNMDLFFEYAHRLTFFQHTHERDSSFDNYLEIKHVLPIDEIKKFAQLPISKKIRVCHQYNESVDFSLPQYLLHDVYSFLGKTIPKNTEFPLHLLALQSRESRYILNLLQKRTQCFEPSFSPVAVLKAIEMTTPLDTRFMLPPDVRKRILALARPGEKLLWRIAGYDPADLPELPEPCDLGWEPFFGIPPEAAERLAQKLTSEHLEQLLEIFRVRIPKPDEEVAVLVDALQREKRMRGARGCAREQAKASVLTLTRNHQTFIAQNIESVMMQKTAFPVEHIIIDDCSYDKTKHIVRHYAATYGHIRLLERKTRATSGENVQELFQHARSQYVALCDGDDYFTDPHKLQKQVECLDADPESALCFHPVKVLYEDGSDRSRVYPLLENLPGGLRPSYALEDLLRFNMIQTNSVMYRWRFKDGLPEWFRADLFPGDRYWHLLHAEMGGIAFINELMSVYRRHKKAVYYSAEINSKFHRNKTGLAELEMYKALNEHFAGKYQSIIFDMATGVLADIFLYACELDDNSIINIAVEKYPDFAKYFLKSLKDL